MTDRLSASRSIQSELLPSGVRYILPRRGPLRLVGCVPVIFGMCFSGFAVFWMFAVRSGLFDRQGRFQWHGLLFMLFGVPFVLAGLAPISAGLYILFGHREVRIREGQLEVVHRLGLFSLTKSRSLDQVQRLVVREAATTENAKVETAQLPIGTGTSLLLAEGREGKPLHIATLYPREVLVELANVLAERINSQASARLVSGGAGRVEVLIIQASAEVAGDAAPPFNPPVATQPPSSRISLHEQVDGLTLTIPPVGLLKGSMGLFVFSLIWLGFCSLFLTLMITSGDAPWFAFLFIGGFLLIGAAALIAAINMGRRRAIIDVVHDTLLVSQKNLFGTKQKEWSAKEIQAIRVGPSGLTVNDRPVLELQIHRHSGGKSGFFAGRPTEELHWLAAVLRDALCLRDMPGWSGGS